MKLPFILGLILVLTVGYYEVRIRDYKLKLANSEFSVTLQSWATDQWAKESDIAKANQEQTMELAMRLADRVKEQSDMKISTLQKAFDEPSTETCEEVELLVNSNFHL